MAQTTQTHSKLKFCLYCTPLAGQIALKPQFWGCEWVFSSHSRQIWNFRIFKTTESIVTKFRVVIETTKYSLSVVQIGSQQIQDGGQLQSL